MRKKKKFSLRKVLFIVAAVLLFFAALGIVFRLVKRDKIVPELSFESDGSVVFDPDV